MEIRCFAIEVRDKIVTAYRSFLAGSPITPFLRSEGLFKNASKTIFLVGEIALAILLLRANAPIVAFAFTAGVLFHEQMKLMIKKVNVVVLYSPLPIQISLSAASMLAAPISVLLLNFYISADLGQRVAHTAFSRHDSVHHHQPNSNSTAPAAPAA